MEKQHYKMYKDGKKWVFAAVTVIALGVGLSESTYVVKADSTVTIASTDDSVNTG
ncbi:KxYKxGKxW signal peptide domain-containing protein, partial [Loigolactobacillus coryniformis]